MKYPYIPLDPIISELRAQLKTLSKMGKFEVSDCYQYAVQCLRLIGSHQFDVNEYIIQVKNHRGATPPNFYLFDEVRYCLAVEQSENCINVDDTFYMPGDWLRPVDTFSTSMCHSSFFSHHFHFKDQFNVKVPPGVITVLEQRNCLLYVKYYGLKTDDEGNMMVQDEEHSIQAIKNYIKLTVLQEDYIMGTIPRYVYKDIESDYKEQLDAAQNELMAMAPIEEAHLLEVQRRRLNKFKLK